MERDPPRLDQLSESAVREYKLEDLKVQNEYLGRGSSGKVDVVVCNGIRLARKRITVTADKREKLRDFREHTILRKLSHKHIVQFVGAYIEGATIGLLTLPVAVCDLAVFLDAASQPDSSEFRRIREAFDMDVWPTTRSPTTARKSPNSQSELALSRAHLFLRSLFGCIANAVQYIHENDIRYKDIKPSNILLTPNGVYCTDFGISKDVSELVRSGDDTRTEGYNRGYRGTPRYFAPEIAHSGKRGRAADIFSLGCVFLEVSAVLSGFTLGSLKALILQDEEDGYEHFRYYQKLSGIASWLRQMEDADHHVLPKDFYQLLRSQLRVMPEDRPSASQIALRLYELGGPTQTFHGICCKQDSPSSHTMRNPDTATEPHTDSPRAGQFTYLTLTALAVSLGLWLQRQQPSSWAFTHLVRIFGIGTYMKSFLHTAVLYIIFILLGILSMNILSSKWRLLLLMAAIAAIPTDITSGGVQPAPPTISGSEPGIPRPVSAPISFTTIYVTQPPRIISITPLASAVSVSTTTVLTTETLISTQTVQAVSASTTTVLTTKTLISTQTVQAVSASTTTVLTTKTLISTQTVRSTSNPVIKTSNPVIETLSYTKPPDSTLGKILIMILIIFTLSFVVSGSATNRNVTRTFLISLPILLFISLGILPEMLGLDIDSITQKVSSVIPNYGNVKSVVLNVSRWILNRNDLQSIITGITMAAILTISIYIIIRVIMDSRH